MTRLLVAAIVATGLPDAQNKYKRICATRAVYDFRGDRLTPSSSRFDAMSFCIACGTKAVHRIPDGDHLPRLVCPACGHIHYENPRLIVGCIAEWDERILLCKRAIEPRLGYWTLPAGFMENGESTCQAAIRETWEEAGARVRIDAAFAMINIAHINQVHLFYRGKMADAAFSAGEESLEVRLFAPTEIPWEEISFHSVRHCLEAYLSERDHGRYSFHELSLAP